MELRANPGQCEEASIHSRERYIPCNAPAARWVYSRVDNYTYRMCGFCADHNVKNRGGIDRGPYTKGQPPMNPSDEPIYAKYDPKTWDWYAHAWSNVSQGRPIPPIHDGEPHTSALRVNLYEGGPYLPLQYWYSGSALRAQLNGIIIPDPNMPLNLIRLPDGSQPFVGDHTAMSIWPFAAKNPVSDEMMDFWNEHKRWPDSSPAVHSATHTKVTERTSRSVEGDNRPPPTPEYTPGTYDHAKGYVMPMILEAQNCLKNAPAKTKIEADKAAVLVGALHAFHKTKAIEHAKTDPRIVALKPHIDQYKAIGAEWTDLHAMTAIWQALKKDYIGPWLIAQEAVAAATPPNSRGETAQPLQAGGGATNTRTIHLREVRKAHITDYGKLAEQHVLDPPIVEAFQALADAAAAKGICLPGCEIVTTKVPT